MSDPKKWTEIYPYGTKEGDEEAKFFKHLARHPKYDYRSVSQLIKSTGLTKERIEEIISKYAEGYDPPLIYPHPTNDDHWGYWERCPDQVKTDHRGISRKDKDQRIDKQLTGSSPSMTGDPGADPNSVVHSMQMNNNWQHIAVYSDGEAHVDGQKLPKFQDANSNGSHGSVYPHNRKGFEMALDAIVHEKMISALKDACRKFRHLPQ